MRQKGSGSRPRVISDPLIQQRTLQEIKDFGANRATGLGSFCRNRIKPTRSGWELGVFPRLGQEDRLKANLVVFGRFFRNEISQKEVPALFGPGKLKIFDPFLDFRYLKISLLEEVNGLKGDEHCGIFGSFKFRPFAVRFQSLQDSTSFCPKALCLFNL